MSVPLPVAMVPLVGRAVASGGFAAAVMIGLALYAAAKAKEQQAAKPK